MTAFSETIGVSDDHEPVVVDTVEDRLIQESANIDQAVNAARQRLAEVKHAYGKGGVVGKFKSLFTKLENTDDYKEAVSNLNQRLENAEATYIDHIEARRSIGLTAVSGLMFTATVKPNREEQKTLTAGWQSQLGLVEQDAQKIKYEELKDSRIGKVALAIGRSSLAQSFSEIVDNNSQLISRAGKATMLAGAGAAMIFTGGAAGIGVAASIGGRYALQKGYSRAKSTGQERHMERMANSFHDNNSNSEWLAESLQSIERKDRRVRALGAATIAFSIASGSVRSGAASWAQHEGIPSIFNQIATDEVEIYAVEQIDSPSDPEDVLSTPPQTDSVPDTTENAMTTETADTEADEAPVQLNDTEVTATEQQPMAENTVEPYVFAEAPQGYTYAMRELIVSVGAEDKIASYGQEEWLALYQDHAEALYEANQEVSYVMDNGLYGISANPEQSFIIPSSVVSQLEETFAAENSMQATTDKIENVSTTLEGGVNEGSWSIELSGGPEQYLAVDPFVHQITNDYIEFWEDTVIKQGLGLTEAERDAVAHSLKDTVVRSQILQGSKTVTITPEQVWETLDAICDPQASHSQYFELHSTENHIK